MRKFILDLIFPVKCLGCSAEGQFICPSCLSQIPINQGLPKEKLIITTDYKNLLIKESIHQFKYGFVQELSKPLGEIMSQKLSSYFNNESNILIPIPLHQKRLKWRGFNQSELLAQEIGKKLNIQVINNLLIRNKNTLPQAKIKNAQEREKNIKNVFELASFPPSLSFPRKRESRNKLTWIPNQVGNDNKFKNKTFILIDDVSTTGGTIQECAKVLKPLKPKEIWGLVLARG